MDAPTIDCVASLPLYKGLNTAEVEEVAAGLRPILFGDGDPLMAQGDEADGAYFIVSGHARVLTKLPGGGETPIADVGPGSMLGELALIREASRGATVRAQGEVEALFADRRYFQAALAQLRPVAIKVARNLAEILASRLHRQQERISEYVESQPEGAYFSPMPRAAEAVGEPDFDFRAFLPILPCFRDFRPRDLVRVSALAEAVQAPPGLRLDGDGDGETRAWVVVRGAVMSCLPHARTDTAHQLHIFGPGSFCAVDRLVEPGPLPVRYVARENATLLTFTEPAFRELFDGLDPLALNFTAAINDNLAGMVARAGNHLTRLVGLARLYRQHAESPDVAI